MWPRVLGRVRGDVGSPTLLGLGSVHGNEPAGVLGLRQVIERLRQDPTGLRGELVGFTGNRKALKERVRYLFHDLNRHWSKERVERLRRIDGPLDSEDDELRDLDRHMTTVLEEAEGAVYVIDLHTTSGEGPPFVVLDDTLPNRAFAMPVPVPLVVGLEEELPGTVTHHLHRQGCRVFGFEAGQHDDPVSADRAAAAVWIALETSGVLEPGRPEVAAARALLADCVGDLAHVVEVRYRHPVTGNDEFVMRAGYENFDPVKAGEVLAHDQRGPVHAPEKGMILMPLYQRQGEDGFFIVKDLKPIWMRISSWLRYRNAEKLLPLLPGVRRHDEIPDAFIVDRRYARFLALEFFHLLGYRRRTGPRQGRFLVMSRRRHDVLR